MQRFDAGREIFEREQQTGGNLDDDFVLVVAVAQIGEGIVLADDAVEALHDSAIPVDAAGIGFDEQCRRVLQLVGRNDIRGRIEDAGGDQLEPHGAVAQSLLVQCLDGIGICFGS